MAIEPVVSSDTPNAGRVKWNANDTELSGRIDDADAALTTHKSSADHDSSIHRREQVQQFAYI